MGGDATFSGTSYQAKVTAYIYAYMLRQRPLGWLPLVHDVPIVVDAETGGPGDDVRVQTANGTSFEVQAKHGLGGGKELQELVLSVQQRSKDSDLPVVVAVDETATGTVRNDFAKDLDRIRFGRQQTDQLTATTRELLEKTRLAPEALKRLFVVTVALDTEASSHTKDALLQLESALEDARQTFAMWSILLADASLIAAQRQGRTRGHLVDLLRKGDAKLRPIGPDERWSSRLDFNQALINGFHTQAALADLRTIEAEIAHDEVTAATRARVYQQRGSALLRAERVADAESALRNAIERDPKNWKALCLMGQAKVRAGDLETALRYCDRAVAAAPEEPEVWALLARVRSTRGEEAPQPSTSIANSAPYRQAVLDIALDKSDFARAIDLSQALLGGAQRPVQAVFARGYAEAQLALASEPFDRERCEEGQRLLTEVIDDERNIAHPLRVKALIVRSALRSSLDDDRGAAADAAEAERCAPNDPDQVRRSVQVAMQAGDDARALDILRADAANNSSYLLGIRATLRAKTDVQGAKTDVEKARSLIKQHSKEHDDDAALLSVAGAYLALDDNDSAHTLLNEIPSTRRDVRYEHMAGRIAMRRKEYVSARDHYARAKELLPSESIMFAHELGGNLINFGQHELGISVLEWVSAADLPDRAKELLCRAYLQTAQFAKANTMVANEMTAVGAPAWAVRAAVALAQLQEDTGAVAKHLETLVGLDEASTSTRLTFCAVLVASNRLEEARKHIEPVLETSGLTGNDLVRIAALLGALGDPKRSSDFYLRAIRQASHDPDVHKSVIAAFFSGKLAISETKQISAQTYALLRAATGEERRYLIYEQEPVDRSRDEILLEDAEALGISGKSVGDSVRLEPDSWNAQTFEIVTILPVLQHLALNSIERFPKLFPKERPIAWAYKVGDPGSVNWMAPLIGGAFDRQKFIAELCQAYRKTLLPLGYFAQQLHISIPGVMAMISTSIEVCGPLTVEWIERDRFEASVRAAQTATSLVLTRSALHTLLALDLHGTLPSRFSLLYPESLKDEIQRELEEAKLDAESGKSALVAGADRPYIAEKKANDPTLRARVDSIEKALSWLLQTGKPRVRPLERIGAPGSESELLRTNIGRSSWDAATLATQPETVLCADDIGLRVLHEGQFEATSCSTISLIAALERLGLISRERQVDAYLQLVRARYAAIPPSAELFRGALAATVRDGRSELPWVFTLIVAQQDLAQAARMGAQLLREAALASLTIVPIDEITRLILLGLVSRWTKAESTAALRNAAAESLALLSPRLREVLRACDAFMRND